MSAEMCFMRRTVSYTLWNDKRDEEVIRELQIVKSLYLLERTG